MLDFTACEPVGLVANMTLQFVSSVSAAMSTSEVDPESDPTKDVYVAVVPVTVVIVLTPAAEFILPVRLPVTLPERSPSNVGDVAIPVILTLVPKKFDTVLIPVLFNEPVNPDPPAEMPAVEVMIPLAFIVDACSCVIVLSPEFIVACS